jgi:hypothetical protein
LRASAKRKRFARANGTTLTVRLSAPATVTVTIAHCPARGRCKKPKRVRTVTRSLRARRATLAIGERRHRLSAGRYVVEVRARAKDGRRAGPLRLNLTVTR